MCLDYWQVNKGLIDENPSLLEKDGLITFSDQYEITEQGLREKDKNLLFRVKFIEKLNLWFCPYGVTICRLR
jgi:DNA-binding PadR family transcriptional regulator